MPESIPNTSKSDSHDDGTDAGPIGDVLLSIDDPFAVAITTAVLADNAKFVLGLASDDDRKKFSDKYETFWIERALESKPNSLLGVRTALRFISEQFKDDLGPKSDWGLYQRLTNHCIEESLYFLEELEEAERKAGAA